MFEDSLDSPFLLSVGVFLVKDLLSPADVCFLIAFLISLEHSVLFVAWCFHMYYQLHKNAVPDLHSGEGFKIT